MKKIYFMYAACALMYTNSCWAGDFLEDLTQDLYGTSFFTPRSQSTDAARDLVGWHRFMHRDDTCDPYGALAATFEFTQSVRSKRLAQYFFGTDFLTISGSFQGEPQLDYFLADYFGLSPQYNSDVLVRPILKNVIVDLAGFWGYQQWYFAIHAPLVWTQTHMRLEETINDAGIGIPYPAGYMAVDAIPAPYTSFRGAMQGVTGFGQVEPLRFGKIACGPRAKAGLSNVLAILGYDLVNRGYGYAGFNLRLAMPTGNRPTSEYIFEPIVGDGKHWELGLGFSGKVLLWEQDGEQETNFFVDINAMHLFKSAQRRSFDFKYNGFGSRYILLKEFDADGVYTGHSLPAINVTTLCVDVSNAIMIDFVLMFGYQYNEFNFDIGYNGWVRSKDKICLNHDPFKNRNFAFKGIQNVRNADLSTDSTQSTATISGNAFDDQAAVADPNPPVFIGTCNLDIESAASPLQLTNAIFWHFSFAPCVCAPSYYTPFIGFGGKVEFEGVRPKQVLPNKNSLSQWAMWIKGGVGW
jgi:hypothetical protein